MKNKKNTRIGKVLLIMTSVVLVAAISVYGTLAFLTATTQELTNSFQSSTGISGKVDEPSFPGGRTGGSTSYEFGTPVPKDPLIQNTGTNDMFVGLKLDFYLNAQDDTDANFVKVPYTTFAKYVTIKGDAPNTGAFNTTYWHEETPSNVTDSKIFTYRPGSGDFTRVTASNGDLSLPSAGSALPSTAYTAGTDNTYPIFNSVQISNDVNKAKGVTFNHPTSAVDFAAGPAGLNFEVLNFKIVVTGHGVQADGATDNATILSDIMGGLDPAPAP